MRKVTDMTEQEFISGMKAVIEDVIEPYIRDYVDQRLGNILPAGLRFMPITEDDVVVGYRMIVYTDLEK